MPSKSTIITKKQILSAIVKNYNTLQYSHQLIEWLVSIYPARDFSKLNKFELHKQLNRVLTESYNGELLYKYSLFKKFKYQNLVAAFEMKVNNSRVDFLTINGSTTSFEIKSTVDNLTKLSKQADDYLSVFEYNNVIVDEKHTENCKSILPASFGIIVFKNQKQRTIRKASLNNTIKPEIQLDLLSKKELLTYFRSTQSSIIFETINPKVINSIFKKALKARYYGRWNFIVDNSNKILPIDIQFFFNTQIPPKTIYC
jgi:hypothetical protein